VLATLTVLVMYSVVGLVTVFTSVMVTVEVVVEGVPSIV